MSRMLKQSKLATAANDLIVSDPNGATRIESIWISNNSATPATFTIYHPFLNEATTVTSLLVPTAYIAGNTVAIVDTAIPLAPGERLVALASTTNLSATIYGTV